jgi:hypothetical protein
LLVLAIQVGRSVALATSVAEVALHDCGAVEVAGLGNHPLHGARLADDQRVRLGAARGTLLDRVRA